MIPSKPTARHPRVRAVVVSWNGARLLPSCLDSLLSQSVAADLEVVVVDNASVEGTVATLAERHPTVIVVRSETNLGFAGGAGLGVAGFGVGYRAAQQRLTFVTVAIEQMIAVMEGRGNERVEAVAGKIMLTGNTTLSADSPWSRRRLAASAATTTSGSSPPSQVTWCDPRPELHRQRRIATRDRHGPGLAADRGRRVPGHRRIRLLRRGRVVTDRGAGRSRRIRSRAVSLLRGHRHVVAPARGRAAGRSDTARRPSPITCTLPARKAPARCSATTTRATHCAAGGGLVPPAAGRVGDGGSQALRATLRHQSTLPGLAAFICRLPRALRERQQRSATAVSRAEIARLLR